MLIVVDLCQANYQTLSIAKNAWQEKKSGQNVNLLDIKIIDWMTDAKNVINYALSHQIKR